MPLSRKRHITKKKIKKNKPKPYEVVKQSFVRMNNPIPADMPFEKRVEMISKIGKSASAQSKMEYEKLADYFKDYDSLYLCSFCARYFNTSQEGIDEEAITGHLDFPPFALEILQCLCLKFPRTISDKPLNENIADFKATITNFCRNNNLSHLQLLENAKSSNDIERAILRSEIVGQTIAIRNWAYLGQMKDVAYNLAKLTEPRFTTTYGFSSKIFLDILFELPFIAENKLNIHIQKISAFLKAKKSDEIFDAYETNFPHIEKMTSESRCKMWERLGKNRQNLKSILLAHSDYYLQDIYTYNTIEVKNTFSGTISENDIRSVLSLLSWQFGELSHINEEYIFLNNPTNKKPLIKLDKDHYFSAIPHLFIHLGVDLLEQFVAKDSKSKTGYVSKKGAYLEQRVEELFKKSFPNANIASGNIWQCPNSGKRYENDLLVVIDDFAIIVECKSGAISAPARRGAPERLFKTMEELVVAPSEQAIRFENYLKTNPQIHIFNTKSGCKNTVDISKVKYFVPLGITLSNLGSIGSNLKMLINAGVTYRRVHELAPSINITDLEIIFEILSLRAEKVHYLSRRREFEAHVNFRGDEIDLFGFYLETGFNIGETEFDESNHIEMTLKSKDLDPYFIGKDRGRDIKKPLLEKTQYWNDILNRLEANSQYWLIASYILLHMPKEDQLKFERNLKLLSQKIRRGKCSELYNWMIMFCGPNRRKYAIVAFPYSDTDREIRNQLIEDIFASVKRENKLRGVLILGYNLDKQHYPYSIIAVNTATEFLDSLEV